MSGLQTANSYTKKKKNIHGQWGLLYYRAYFSFSLETPTTTSFPAFLLQPCTAMFTGIQMKGSNPDTAAHFLVWAQLLPHLLRTVPGHA